MVDRINTFWTGKINYSVPFSDSENVRNIGESSYLWGSRSRERHVLFQATNAS
jgi:hypothetical protein